MAANHDAFFQALKRRDEAECLRLLATDPAIAQARTSMIFGGQAGEPQDFEGLTHSVLTAVTNEKFPTLVEALLNAGADVGATGMFGETALHMAAWLGFSEIVIVLLRHHSPLEALDTEFNATPFGWAVHGASPLAWADLADQVAAARLLVAAGATVRVEDLDWMEKDFAPLPDDMLALFQELRSSAES